MGLLAVMGPSINDHLGCPLWMATIFSKAWLSFQNLSTSCSWALKSTLLGTSLNGMVPPIRFNKKLSSQIRDESAISILPRYHPGSHPLGEHLRCVGSHLVIDYDPRALATVRQLRLSYLRLHAFRSQLRKDFQPVVLPRLAPIPGSLAGRQAYSFPSSLFYVRLAQIMPQVGGLVN